MIERTDVAYYYPAPFWQMNEGGWVKSLLLFFDKISILLPDYMHGRHHFADPVLAEPLEDLGLLEILEPKVWVDGKIAQRLSEAVTGMLTNGVFDDLPETEYFHELSQSRIGYAADVELAKSLVSQLEEKGLAKPSEDGVSIPLHPAVRTTILVVLAQLARSAGKPPYRYVHPTTNNLEAIQDLVATLSRERMPSRENVIAFDLEPVSLDMDSVPLDELLAFRLENKNAHQTYTRDLRRFMNDLAEIQDADERQKLLLGRRDEIADSARDLQRNARESLKQNLPSCSIGLLGCAWAVMSSDPIGFILSAAGLGESIRTKDGQNSTRVDAYSYLFRVEKKFGM